MNDLLLKELGDLARHPEEAERAHLDERWDRLAAGTLTAEEEIELKALATSSPEAREAYLAFKPLGAEFQARMANAINRQQAPSPKPVHRFEVWVGAAAAVALFVWVLWPPPMLTSGYQASLEGGFKQDRGGEAAPPDGKQVFAPGSPFNLEVNPKQPLEHTGEVGARAYVMARAHVRARAYLSHSAGWEDLRPLGLEDKFEPGETGSVRLAATMGEDDLKVPPGDWIFWTVVARNSLPKTKEVQTRLRANRPRNDSWQDICDALKQEENPPPASWQVACVGFRTEGQPDP